MTEAVLSDLERFPLSRDIHHLADYVELLCLANLDGVVARADVLDRWAERTDVGEELASEGAGDPGPAPVAGLGSSGTTSALQERRAVVLDDVFRHLQYRRKTFGDSYPFGFTALGGLARNTRLSRRKKLYVFLLLAASLRYVRKEDQHALTTAFERFAAEAIGEWLAPAARVYLFGTSAPPNSRYRGSLYTKLQRLAGDLFEQLYVDRDQFRRGDSGDAGTDIVAWLPFNDGTSSLSTFLAQATCQLDWTRKQGDSGRDKWRRVMSFTAPHNNVMCIPFCFRDGTGSWARPADIWSSILIDRVRLEGLMRDKRGSIDSVPYGLVDRALAFKESAV